MLFLFVYFTFSRCSIVTCTVIRKNVTKSVILENPYSLLVGGDAHWCSHS